MMKNPLLFASIAALFFACTPAPQGSAENGAGTRTESHLQHAVHAAKGETSRPEESSAKPTITHSKSTEKATAPVPAAPKAVQLELKRAGYQFKAPDTNWVIVSDPTNELAALEFFQPKTGLRATLEVSETSADESIQIADRAQAELLSRRGGATKVQFSELHAIEVGHIMGMGWETGFIKDNQNQQSTGLVALLADKVFLLTMSSGDKIRDRAEFTKAFQQFFAGLTVDPSLLEGQGPAVGKEQVRTFHSDEMAYGWKTTDTLWHKWSSLEAMSTDPDLTLVNASEELSMFVYSANINADEVSSEDLFHVFLSRLGLDPKSKDLVENKKGSGEKFTEDFETVRLVSGFDFRYKGRFVYDHGRGVLLATWTQNSMTGKFAKAMERALEGLSVETIPAKGLPIQARKAQEDARIVNQVGLLRLAEDQPLVALSFFEKANHMDQTEPLYLINCGFVYQSRSLFGPGTDHFLSQIELVKKSGKLLFILGEMYESLHDYNRALEYEDLAVKYMPNDPELVINISDALWGMGQRTQSLEVVQALYAKQPSSRLGVYMAKTLMGLDQYAEAVDFLFAVKKRFGMSKDLGVALMDGLTFLGRHQEALAVSDELLPKVKEDWEVWTARGKTEFHLKQFRMAENSLQKAIQLKADNDDARSFLAATKAFLGKADNHALQTSIEPASARPKNLKDMISAHLSDSAHAEEFPAVVHWQEEALKSPKAGPWVRTEQALVEILDTRGAGLFQEFTYSFLPGYDRIFVNALEVYDANWKLKGHWSVNQAYITYLKEKGSNGDAQMAHLPLTDLKPGDFVYIQVSRTSIENTGVVPFTHHTCSREIPVGLDVFRIVTDTTQIAMEDYGPVQHKAIAGGIEWHLDHPVVIRKEVFMPVYRDFGAGVLVAGKQTWEQVGRDYQNMIQHQFKASIPVREKAFEVQGNRMVNQELVFRIADWVRENISYRDEAFGGHSLIPSPSLETLKEHQGDCKDQSLLLKEMLDALGVKSELALIHLQEPGSEALPTIQQFNHMILHVPATKTWPELWLDPSDKAGARRPIPLDLEGKVTLVINGDSSYQTITPVLEKDQEHQAFLDHAVFIDNNGKAEFRDSLALHGKFASMLRAEMLSRDSKERQKYLADWLTQAIPDAALSNLKIENVLEFSKPLVLILTFTSEHYFSEIDGKIQGVFPNLWERSFMRLPKVTHRHHPLRLPHETTFSWKLRVKACDGCKVSIQAPTGIFNDLSYILVEDGPTVGDGKSSMRWLTQAVYADPAEYENIRSEWERVLDQTAPMITIEKK